jgi:hypothetical protein
MRYMAYEPGEPKVNLPFSETDRLEEIDKELEDTGDNIFGGVDAADALNKKAEEAARLYREKQKSNGEDIEQKHAA